MLGAALQQRENLWQIHACKAENSLTLKFSFSQLHRFLRAERLSEWLFRKHIGKEIRNLTGAGNQDACFFSQLC